MASRRVGYTVICVAGFCGVRPISGQEVNRTRDSLRAAHTEYCIKASAPDRSRLSSKQYGAALWGLASCGEGGGRLLATLWRTPPKEDADVNLLMRTSSRNPSQEILREVIRVARDRSQPTTTRLAAAQVMTSYAWPTFDGVTADSDTTAPNVRPEILKADLLLRRSWVHVSYTPHAASDRVLPGVKAQVLREFNQIVKEEPETRFGKIVEVLAYWLHR